MRLLIRLLAVVSFAIVAASSVAQTIEQTYLRLGRDIDHRALADDIRTLSSFPSRLAGSSGEAQAFDVIEARLKALGAVNIHREPFRVAVPDPESKGIVRFNGMRIDVWPIWPNHVRPSTCTVSGPLVYGGSGSLEELRGKALKGAIVLLEFDSGARWKNAAKLGAQAIIFIESRTMTRGEAEPKFSSTPLSIPRFYVPLKTVGPLLSAAFRNIDATLQCRQSWIEGSSCNLVAEFPGSGAESITLSSYVDSMSIVPGLAPGASQSCGMASALELARIYAKRSHVRTLRFVFSGAHFLALQGARSWVRRRIETGDDPGLVDLSLDLSAGSRTLGVYARGWFYEYRDEANELMKPMGRRLRSHVERLAKALEIDPPKKLLVDATNNGDGRSWKNNIPGKFAFDCEPRVMAGMNALTLATIEDARDVADSPHDVWDQIDVSNLARQTHVIAVVLHHVLNDTSRLDSTSDFRVPVAPANPSPMRLVGGFATLTGHVVQYQPQKSFIPDTPVPKSLVAIEPRQKTMMGVRGTVLAFTEGDKAEYRIDGAAPLTAFPQDRIVITRISAYHINDDTGAIDFAPSLGHYGDESYPVFFSLKTASRTSPIVVFRCVSTDFYDLIDPQELTAFRRFSALDADTGAAPGDFFFTEPPFDTRLNPEVEDCQALFTVPGQNYFFFGGSIGENRMSLIRAAKGIEKGLGFTAPSSGSVVFPSTALAAARDFVSLNQTRLAKFKKYRIVSPGIEAIETQAEDEVHQAEQTEIGKDWPAFERHSRAAWALALRAYPIIKDTSNDVVNGVVFYLFLLIPFSYFLERLTVGSESISRQIAFCAAYFIGSFILLRLVHPAFEIVTNPTMIFIGFVMGTLSLLVVTFVLSKFEGSMRAIKKAQVGRHEVDVRRSSVAMAAFNLGVGNMRRRKARTALTTLTLVVMTFIVLSFTSIVPEVTLNEYPSETPARFSGLLLRNPGLEPMQLATYRQLDNEFGDRATVTRRATYYGADVGDSGILTLQRGDQSADVRVMAGFDPAEAEVLRPQEALLPGGRWFRPGETDAMILPLPLAEQLRIDVKEVGKATVSFGGAPYRVIGILDAGLFRSIVDLDGDGIAPADFSLSKRFQEEGAATNKAFRSYVRIDPANVFIVPAETALRIGADLRSIGVGFKDANATRPALQSLMPRLRMNLYASTPNKQSGALEIRQFSVLQGSKGVGIGLVIIQLLIASIFVLNTMIASVVERTREISIFSSIGLAPGHIAMLFFAESVVYGVLGSVIGYFAAQISARILVATGALPGLTLNFSSTSAVMSAGLVMGVVVLSTIYPAYKASQIAAPGAHRDDVESEPDGDEWEVVLPFSIDTVEAGAVVEFLAEWLRGYEGFTIGEFVTAETRTRHGEHEDAVMCTTWLAPYDLGVSQKVELIARPSAAPNVSSLTLRLSRESGDPENWVTVNKRFMGVIRRQFLTWRTLPRELREQYRPEVGVGV